MFVFVVSLCNWKAKWGPSLGRWMESFVLPCMVVSGLYIYLFVCAVHSCTSEVTKDLTDSTGYGGRLGDFSMDMLGLEMVVNDEENGCGFED